jgi:hypothetical protein
VLKEEKRREEYSPIIDHFEQRCVGECTDDTSMRLQRVICAVGSAKVRESGESDIVCDEPRLIE